MAAPIRDTGIAPDDLRERAMMQVRKKRELQGHLIAYLTVNAFLVVLWLYLTPNTFFWPLFPIFGWGIGVVFHVWDVYSPARMTEEQIQREMHRLRR